MNPQPCAPQSKLIILVSYSYTYKSLNGKNTEFVQIATYFYTKIPLQRTSSILLELIWYEGLQPKGVLPIYYIHAHIAASKIDRTPFAAALHTKLIQAK